MKSEVSPVVLDQREYLERHLVSEELDVRTHDDFNVVGLIGPGLHECPVRYGVHERRWHDSGCNYAFAIVHSNGRMFVAYTDETDEDGAMFLRIRHPREAIEMIRLMKSPLSFFQDEVEAGEPVPLSSMAEFRVLLPCRDSWKALDPSHPPEGAPKEFMADVTRCVRDYEWPAREDLDIATTSVYEAWPQWIDGLPDADSLLREGYIVPSNMSLVPGSHLRDGRWRPARMTAKLLILPAPDNQTSWFWLREFLSFDQQASSAARRLLKGIGKLGSIPHRAHEIMLPQPRDYLGQIRQAAEINMTRQWLTFEAQTLARQRRPFGELRNLYWQAARTLDGINDPQPLRVAQGVR